MLIITIEKGQHVTIGSATVHVLDILGPEKNKIKVGVDAPLNVQILRSNAKCRIKK